MLAHCAGSHHSPTRQGQYQEFVSEDCDTLHGSFPKMGGPQNTVFLIMGTRQKAPQFLGNSHIRGRAAPSTSGLSRLRFRVCLPVPKGYILQAEKNGTTEAPACANLRRLQNTCNFARHQDCTGGVRMSKNLATSLKHGHSLAPENGHPDAVSHMYPHVAVPRKGSIHPSVQIGGSD